MTTALSRKRDTGLEDSLATRVEAIDWTRVAADLDASGVAPLKGLLTANECTALAELYANENTFRGTIVMARHGFGRGEYKYFAYPLPAIIAPLDRKSTRLNSSH